MYKKAYDIRRACRSVFRHQTLTQNRKNTNHRVYLFFIIFVKLFEYYYLFLFFYLSIIIYFYSFNYWLLYNYTPYDLYFYDFGGGVGVERRCGVHAWCHMLFYTLLRSEIGDCHCYNVGRQRRKKDIGEFLLR